MNAVDFQKRQLYFYDFEIEGHIGLVDVPLTNRVRFFSASIHGPRASKSGHKLKCKKKKPRPLNYSKDREKEVIKMFITSLEN